MKKLYVPVLLLIVCPSIIGMALTVNSKNLFETFNRSQPIIPESQKQSASSTVPTQSSLPQHIKYFFLFRHLSNIKGTPGATRFQAKAGLNPGQLQALISIAINNEKEVKKLDEQAKAIVDAFHAQYPPGILPLGVAPPALPQLNVLQQQREETILRFREQLQRMLGEEEFTRFDAFVNDEIGGNTSSQN